MVDAARALFNLEEKVRTATAPKAEFTKSRESYYKELIEAEEQRVLETIMFDFEFIDYLPYGSIRTFCD